MRLPCIHLPLSPELRLELGNAPEHVEQQASRRIARVNMLIEDLQVDLLAMEFGRSGLPEVSIFFRPYETGIMRHELRHRIGPLAVWTVQHLGNHGVPHSR